MYKSILFGLTLSSIVSSVFTAAAFGPAVTHPSNPNECYHNGNYYKCGQSWEVEGCSMATCTLLNHTGTPILFIAYESCGSVSVDPSCKTVEDLTQSYPACCPEPVCPDEDDEIEEDDSNNEIDDTHDVITNPKYYDYYNNNQNSEEEFWTRISPKFQFIPSTKSIYDYFLY